jgi:Tfp pilus assembly protein PilX
MTGRARLAGEEGITLIVALAVLIVVGLLATVAISAAVHTSDLSSRDRSQSAALAAADAGLTVATYRLNMLVPDSSHCVTTVVNSPSSGVCPVDGPEMLGDGASFQFQVSPALTGGSCAGQTVTNSVQAVTDRCVTAIGTTNGVTARTQARVDAWAAQPFFPYTVTGLNSLKVDNVDTVNGNLASNGPVTITNNSHVGNIALGGGTASLATSNGATTGTVANVGKIGAAAVPVGNSATVNDDARITSGQDGSSGLSCGNPTHGHVCFVPSTRTLTLYDSSSLTLGGGVNGVYNFCSLTMANGATLTIAAGVKTEIIIDSPDDPNSVGSNPSSSCPAASAGGGNLTINNNATLTTLAATSTALQFYVYGWNNGQNVVQFSNNGSSTFGTLFAPQSTVNVYNNGTLNGAILGLNVELVNGFTFNYGTDAGTLTANSQGLYYRSAWQQCTTKPTTSGNLASGC